MKQEHLGAIARVKKNKDDLPIVMQHALQDMNWYLTHHIHDAQEPILRTKILILYRTCDDARVKSKLRGLLGFLKRWKPIRVYLKIAAIMEAITMGKDTEFMSQGPEIYVKRFVKGSNVLKYVGQKDQGREYAAICKTEHL